MIIDFKRSADLLNLAVVQNHDAICHRHGFDLIMRHVNHGQAKFLLQHANFRTHLAAKLRIKV